MDVWLDGWMRSQPTGNVWPNLVDWWLVDDRIASTSLGQLDDGSLSLFLLYRAIFDSGPVTSSLMSLFKCTWSTERLAVQFNRVWRIFLFSQIWLVDWLFIVIFDALCCRQRRNIQYLSSHNRKGPTEPSRADRHTCGRWWDSQLWKKEIYGKGENALFTKIR